MSRLGKGKREVVGLLSLTGQFLYLNLQTTDRRGRTVQGP